jgi:hypothetical protein
MTSARQLLIALDANIWIAERLLRLALGAALLYTVRARRSRIVLPSVTRREAVEGIVQAGQEAVARIQQGFTTYQAIVGERPEYHVQGPADFRCRAEERFAELADFLLPIDHSPQQIDAALGRVIAGRPPNTKTREQFRDSLLWEIVLELAREHDVRLIARDADFCESNKLAEGLALELRNEVRSSAAQLEFYGSLQDYLATVDLASIGPDTALLAKLLDGALRTEIRSYAERRGALIDGPRESKLERFLTEKAELVAIGFRLEYPFRIERDEREGQTLTGSFTVRGSASYNSASGAIENVQLGAVECLDAGGEQIAGMTTTYAYGNIVLGTRQLPFTVRKQI